MLRSIRVFGPFRAVSGHFSPNMGPHSREKLDPHPHPKIRLKPIYNPSLSARRFPPSGPHPRATILGCPEHVNVGFRFGFRSPPWYALSAARVWGYRGSGIGLMPACDFASVRTFWCRRCMIEWDRRSLIPSPRACCPACGGALRAVNEDRTTRVLTAAECDDVMAEVWSRRDSRVKRWSKPG